MSEECEKLLPGGSALETTILEGTRHLQACYECLRKTVIFRRHLMADRGVKFVLLYDTLATQLPRLFRCKPKLHFFLHLIEESDPKANWTYRDEDWGGTASRVSGRRGGYADHEVFLGQRA